MATTTNFGWTTPNDTDQVRDGALAIRTLGNNIDTSLVDLKGGTTGQVLSKATNADLDFTWVNQDDANAIQNTIVDAKGDLITATANDTPARLAVGTNDFVLVAASGESTGLKWAGTWTTWTPTYSNLTVGNGTVTARYFKLGKIVYFDFKIILGSTSTVGTNATFSLPSNSKSDIFFFDGNILDSGVANYNGAGQVVANTSTVYLKVYSTGGTYLTAGAVSATAPMTWGTNDEYQLHGFYEEA